MSFPPAVQYQNQFALRLVDTSGELPGKQNTKTKTVINYGLKWINTFSFTTVYTVTLFYYVILKNSTGMGSAAKEGRRSQKHDFSQF